MAEYDCLDAVSGAGLGQYVADVPSMFVLVGGNPAGNTRAVLVGAGWVINLAVTEWFIGARPSHLPRTQSTSPILSSAA